MIMEKKKTGKCSQTPKNIKVNTQVKPQDMEPVKGGKSKNGVSWSEVEEATVVVNPDVDSMESRG